MSRIPLPFHSEDISALARSLRGQLTNCEPRPSHLEVLNMLARAGGFRNFQHYRASFNAKDQVDFFLPPPQPEPDFISRIKKLQRFFDHSGILIRWPSKRSQQELCLWVIWSKIPARKVISEKEVDQRLKESHLFGDHTLLRRLLCDYGMLDRTRDGREYRRVEKRPPAEAMGLIRSIGHDKPDRTA